jgi:ADP-ribose pyrophosphatase YjhB (NUDIX family)
LADVRDLVALAQSGLTYAENPFDRDRYQRVLAIASRLVAAGSDALQPTVQRLLEVDRGYATPKVDVRGAVFLDDRVLLVRERRDGKWTLPGGFADVNDLPSQAVEREIREESGYVARARKLAAVWDRRLHGQPPTLTHAYKLFFLCDITGGSAATSTETDGVDFFSLEDLPPLSLPRVTAEHLRRLLLHHHQPDLPTDYD